MSFISFILYLICIFLRPQEWVSLILGAPLVNIFATTTIVLLVFESMGKRDDERLVKAHQARLMVFFFLAILMSHIVHTYFFGLQNSFSVFLPIFILFFVMLNALNSPKRFKFAVWLVIALIVILVAQGVSQARDGYGWAGQALTMQGDGQGGLITRINWVGIFGDPNDLALTFVIAMGFLLPFIFSRGNVLLRLFSLIAAGYLSYGIFLTNSRGGQLALMAAVFYFFIRKTKKFILGGIVGGIAGAAILILGPTRMGSLSSGEASAASRLDLWYGGLQLFKSSPLFGRGFGMFMEDLPQTAHNSYVLAVAELGFVGLFLWMALIYISMKGLLLVQNTNKNLANYALGIQSALIGFCAAAFFLSRTYVILPYMLFAMAGSIVWLSRTDNKSLPLKFDAKDLRNILLLSVGVLVAVVIMIRTRIL